MARRWGMTLGVAAGLLGLVAIWTLAVPADAQQRGGPAGDRFATAAGELALTCLGHASLYFTFQGMTIHVDPWGRLHDYAKLPPADLILITHHHQDHLDPAAVAAIRKPDTILITTRLAAAKLGWGTVLANGERTNARGLLVEALPAYNLVHRRDNGQPYHPKGVGNGYLVTFGGLRVYLAGDTENIPEMKALKGIGVAFLPMNLPYTMTPEMVADAARAFRPKVLYPYHLGPADPARAIAPLVELLRATPEVEVRIRPFGQGS